MAEKIEIEITEPTDGIATIVLKSPSMSDVDAIGVATREIRRFVQENRPHAVIFDFAAVKFFSSLVLGLLLDIRAIVGAYQGEVLISAINPQLHRVFKITNLDKVFRFFPNRESAIEATQAD
jgi:anti-sigma B factor antagonist